MLDRILEFKPDSWTYADYSGKRYVLVTVEPSTDEYDEITSPFKSYTVEKVERVQNPYALGYFLLRKEQLSSRGLSVSEVRWLYHPVNSDKKITALEFNLDVRKYNVTGKTPMFYNGINSIISQYDTFIVCKVLNAAVYSSVVTTNHESEYLAEYVVKISKG